MKKTVWMLIFVGLMGLFAYVAYGHMGGQMQFSNAVVSGKILKIKATDDGIIDTLHVNKGSRVKKGDPLVVLNRDANELMISAAREQLRLAVRDGIEACLNHNIQKNQHALKLEQLEFYQNRHQKLSALKRYDGLSEEERFDIENQSSERRIDANNAKLKVILQGLHTASDITELPEVKSALVTLKNAHYSSHVNVIRAPSDGFVYDVLTQQGMYVSAGDTQIIFIPAGNIKIEANVLESKVAELHQGRKVTVQLDIQNEKPITGHIESIVPSVAAAFSTIPRNNVDSNWIKVSQRIPVLIALENTSDVFLPIGASVTVQVEEGQSSLQETSVSPAKDLQQHTWKTAFAEEVEQLLEDEKKQLSKSLPQSCVI